LEYIKTIHVRYQQERQRHQQRRQSSAEGRATVLAQKSAPLFPPLHHRDFNPLPSTTNHTTMQRPIPSGITADRRPGFPLSKDLKDAIIGSRLAGLTWKEVGEQNGVSPSTARRVMDNFNKKREREAGDQVESTSRPGKKARQTSKGIQTKIGDFYRPQ
jgi:CRP-like cAMP-binding protein